MQIKLRGDDLNFTVNLDTSLQLPEVNDLVVYSGCRYKVVAREWKLGSAEYISLVLERIYAC